MNSPLLVCFDCQPWAAYVRLAQVAMETDEKRRPGLFETIIHRSIPTRASSMYLLGGDASRQLTRIRFGEYEILSPQVDPLWNDCTEDFERQRTLVSFTTWSSRLFCYSVLLFLFAKERISLEEPIAEIGNEMIMKGSFRRN